MASGLSLTSDVKSALQSLSNFGNDPTFKHVKNWAHSGLQMPSFGPGLIGKKVQEFVEGEWLTQKYSDNAGGTVSQLKGFLAAIHELTDIASKILQAYDEAETNQVKALTDLNTAVSTGFNQINNDLAGGAA
jgi:hypothetical protein